MTEAEMGAELGSGFPGEDLETRDPHEARRWVRAYSELLHFKEQVLLAAHTGIASIKEPIARQAAIDADLPILERENDRLRRRLDFWKRRHLELEVPGAN